MLSPIQVRRHWIRKITFDSNDERVKESVYQVQISLSHAERDAHWYVHLKVLLRGNDLSETNYSGQIEFEGIFDVHPDFSKEKVDDLVRMNGGAILYAAAREYILGLTARSKHGPFEMPTIDARMFLNKPENSKKPQTESKPE